jgi:hypothetical protein
MLPESHFSYRDSPQPQGEHQAKMGYQNALKSTPDPQYPYTYRYMQGEPSEWPRSLSPAPLVTSINPREMHRHLNPAHVPTSAAQMRKPIRGEPDYVKRPRRRAEEVDRSYTCNYPGCDKAYGALNHLNTHVRNASHGPKREPKGMHFLNSDLTFRV